jgi:hypothetical protein
MTRSNVVRELQSNHETENFRTPVDAPASYLYST